MYLPGFQMAVADFVKDKGLEVPVQVRLLDLVSEVGELAKESLKGTRYGREAFYPTSEWEGELADAFFALVCVANSTGVNLELALDRALDRYTERLRLKGDASSGR